MSETTPEYIEQTPNDSKKGSKKEKPKKSMQREIFEWVMVIVCALGMAFVLRTFVFEPVSVDGRSMMNTLQDGEYMIATKFDYLTGDPERFDIVICHYPDRTENFVKRIIAFGGETVELRDGELYINGEFVEQNFDRTASARDYGPYTVPEGRYFVMGDNRDNSHDSRASDVGALTREQIRGHVQYVVYPFSNFRKVADDYLAD